MITGVVTAEKEAVMSLSVQMQEGKTVEIDVVIDTGFTGWLTLPSDLITELGLPWLTKGRALLANGQIETFDVHIATVILDGKTIRTMVDAAETDPLIGMSLLQGYEICIKDVHDGEVTLQPISE